MGQYKGLIQKLEDYIREGQGKRARKEIAALNLTSIPRPYIKQIANLAYRVNLPYVSLRVIHKILRPGKKMAEPPTDAELAEYAVALTVVGATRESYKILENLNVQNYSKISLYRCFALISEWKYKESIPHYKKYIKNNKIDDYQKLIGKVNLSDAYIFTENYLEAKDLLAEIRGEIQHQGLKLLYGNALELSAQVAVFQRNFIQAKKFLNLAEESLKESKGIGHFFVQKWFAILNLYQKGAKKEYLADLDRVRAKAVNAGLWESVRECDFFKSCFSKDKDLFIDVYYGTPFESYREKMIQQFEGKISIPNSYEWNAFDRKLKRGVKFDLDTGAEIGSGAALKTGQLLHKMLGVLTSDFYRPFRIGTLFSQIFPDEHFNPISSDDRVDQLVRRIQKWFEENDIPLFIPRKAGAYTLKASRSYRFISSLNKKMSGKHNLCLKSLRDLWVSELFTAKEAAQELDMPLRSVTYVLKSGLEEGAVEKVGNGPKTSYRFKK